MVVNRLAPFSGCVWVDVILVILGIGGKDRALKMLVLYFDFCNMFGRTFTLITKW